MRIRDVEKQSSCKRYIISTFAAKCMHAPSSTGQLRLVRVADGLDIDLDTRQGLWSAEQYLVLTRQTNHLIEVTDGVIGV